jgi:glycosyltransferase involved in cell wall biosynthesis
VNQDDPPFVTIAIPTFNRAALLRECLRSLAMQDYPRDRFEIIVVDDGSTDSTAAVVRSSEDVHYLRQSHAWLNVARNSAVREARGEVIAFLDDDVLVPSSWLAALGRGVRAHPHGGCFGGQIRLRLEGDVPRHCGRHPLGESELNLGDTTHETDFVWGANMAVTRQALELAGSFDESLPWLPNEELEWQHRFRLAGGSIVYLPDAWVWHRRSAEDGRLGVGSLLRRHFERGLGQASFFAATGRPSRLRDPLLRLPRPLAHAVARRCWWGVFEAAGHAGLFYGLSLRRLGRG